jgi:hypothetical protein
MLFNMTKAAPACAIATSPAAQNERVKRMAKKKTRPDAIPPSRAFNSAILRKAGSGAQAPYWTTPSGIRRARVP